MDYSALSLLPVCFMCSYQVCKVCLQSEKFVVVSGVSSGDLEISIPEGLTVQVRNISGCLESYNEYCSYRVYGSACLES